MNPVLRNILAGVAGAFASMPANALLLKPLGRLFGAPTAPAYDPTGDPEAMQVVWRAYFETLDPSTWSALARPLEWGVLRRTGRWTAVGQPRSSGPADRGRIRADRRHRQRIHAARPTRGVPGPRHRRLPPHRVAGMETGHPPAARALIPPTFAADVARLFFMLQSVVLYTTANLLVKALAFCRHSNWSSCAARSASCFCVIWLWKEGAPLLGHNRRWLLVRGLAGMVALSLFFHTIRHIPLASATVIQYLSPIFTVLLAMPLTANASNPTAGSISPPHSGASSW